MMRASEAHDSAERGGEAGTAEAALAQALFSALAEPTRRRILLLLTRYQELCVCELVHALQMAQPRISSHLAALRKGALVKTRRQGLWVHYSLSPDLPAWALRILGEALAGLGALKPFASDAERLRRMPPDERPPERERGR